MRRALVALAGLTLACGISPSEARARREALEAEGRALEQAADAVEARLLAGEARRAVWTELADRRNQITEVSCRVGDAHFQDMARLFEEAAEKGRGLRRQRGWADGAEHPSGMGGPLVSVTRRSRQ
jgi:hypothetical protein